MNLNTEQYFSTVPLIHAPRSVFDRSFTVKTTMNVNKLVPIFVDEAVPGDSFKMNFQCFGRLVNPLVVPIMDELYFETLWFKVPNRLVWSNWERFCGEQDNPDDSTDFLIPTINSGETGFAVGSIADMFGIPVNVPNLDVNSLPFRAYNLIYNQWFRDQNLINSVTVEMGDSDSADNYTLLNSAKMHDFFTSALPFAQKGDTVMLPIGDSAPVVGPSPFTLRTEGGSYAQPLGVKPNPNDNNTVFLRGDRVDNVYTLMYDSGLLVDLANATGASISDFRFAIKLQQYRERNAVGGTRYTEWIKTHFNVDSPDARLQRAEFLGSTREMIDINTVVQTSSSDSTSPQGNLTAFGVISNHGSGFNTSFVEHSYLIGIARIRHNPVYQQGLNRLWQRQTLLDFYLPIFNGISEQPIPNADIFVQGNSVLDDDGEPVDRKAFGFQEAWAEYRYKPSEIRGFLRSGVDGSLDVYHLAQNFSQLPLLNQSFIEENIPVDRVLAVNSEGSEDVPQFVFDFRFNYVCARPMPVRNIPAGLDNRF